MATGTAQTHPFAALLGQRMTDEELGWAEPRLHELGELCAGPINAWAEETDRNPPHLERYDRWGHDVSRVVIPESVKSARRALYDSGFERPEVLRDAQKAGLRTTHFVAASQYLLDQADIGMMCALGTGGDMVARLVNDYAPDDVKQVVMSRLKSGEWWGSTAQLLTERAGGSDLAQIETTATPAGDAWLLNGFKWFASNVDGQAWVVLAKPEGAPDGIRGVASFLVLQERRDGTRNGIRIRRLKDKLGTKTVASAEVELADAEAFLLAPGGPSAGEGSAPAAGDGRGLARMMELTNGARLGDRHDGTGLRPPGLHGGRGLCRSPTRIRGAVVRPPSGASQAHRDGRRCAGRPGARLRRIFAGRSGAAFRPPAAAGSASSQVDGGPSRGHGGQRRH